LNEFICKYCMRFDCKEKGGNIKPCPVDRGEEMFPADFEESYKRFSDWVKTKENLEG